MYCHTEPTWGKFISDFMMHPKSFCWSSPVKSKDAVQDSSHSKTCWLVVSTELENMSQLGSYAQLGWKFKMYFWCSLDLQVPAAMDGMLSLCFNGCAQQRFWDRKKCDEKTWEVLSCSAPLSMNGFSKSRDPPFQALRIWWFPRIHYILFKKKQLKWARTSYVRR